jgi:ABC-type polysaccharide/polyol phosphate export permease
MMPTEHETTAPIDGAVINTQASSFEADDLTFPSPNQKQLAWQDIKDGLLKWPIWLTLAYQDITIRYRRSVLGPFWITLSMAITVSTMGYLYAHLFHTELQRYYPLLAAGMLTWSLIVGLVIESTDGFTTSAGLINQVKLPYTLHIHRIAARNIIIFFHNIIVMVPILAIYHQYEYAQVNWHLFLIIPGLFIIYINAISYGLILAMIGGRYRDISQIIKSLVQIIFFVTPVMWEVTTLPEQDRLFVDLNPFYAFIQLIREPLLGRTPTLHNWIVVIIMTLLGGWISFKMLTRYRARIVYWL